eukprot:m.115044 g.115044  ORF g.115044 m.115044 type:complete len:637 (-) comp13074_c0_seq1:61-1971(-)
MSRNYVDELQRLLQAQYPTYGHRLGELYTFDTREVGQQSFQARVVILPIDRAFDWSRVTSRVKLAKQAAADVALQALAATSGRSPVHSGLRPQPQSRPEMPQPPNHINALQDHLQSLAPSRGCRLETLYHIVAEEVRPQWFQAQVVLLNTDCPEDITMPRSGEFVGLQPARQEAARLALARLHATGITPHCQTALDRPLVVRKKSAPHSRLNLSDRIRELLKEESAGGLTGWAPSDQAFLPPLTDHLLAVSPVVCSASSGNAITAEVGAASLGVLEVDLSGIDDTTHELGDGMAATEGAERVVSFPAEDSSMHLEMELLDSALQRVPPNLGALGEQYVAEWLARQPWVKSGSVRWLNQESEAAADHDIECVPLGEPGRSHVEVKTRWRRCKATMSARQLARLLDPSENFMLVVVGNAHKLLESPPQPPQIRILLTPTRIGHDATPMSADTATVDAQSITAVYASQSSSSAPTRVKRPAPESPIAGAWHAAPPKAAKLSTNNHIVVADAEQAVDAVLDRTAAVGFGSGGSTVALPGHIVDFVITGIGLESAREHWRLNRKRLCLLMTDAASGCGGPAQLAAETLLQVAAEVSSIRSGPKTEVETRVDSVDGERYPLASFLKVYGIEEGLARWVEAQE